MSSKSSLPLIIAASVISGGLAGAVIGAVMAPDSAPLTTIDTVEDTAITRRLAELEQRLNLLGGQLTAWQHDIAPALPLAADDEDVSPQEAIASLERRVDAVAGKVAETFDEAADDAPAGVFEERVAEALHAIRQDEKVTGWRDHVQDKRDRLDDSMAHLTEQLTLNTYQQNALRQAIADQYDREDVQVDMWGRGAADDIVGERKRTDGEQFAAEIASFLSDEQTSDFWAIVSGSAKGTGDD